MPETLADETARSSAAWDRPAVRLVAFGLAGVVATWIGFFGIPVQHAERVIRFGGYYVIFLTFVLAAYWIGTALRARLASERTPDSRIQTLLVIALIALFSLMAINSEPFRSKILNDEFVLQGTAFNMHFFREVGTMTRAYDILGAFLTTDNYLDKRPYLFPFLISLVHDLTGYRVENAFWLNAAVLPITLWFFYLLCRRLTSWRGGMLGIALLGTLPLLGQNATGSGMELLNVCMILAATLLAANYLAEPDERQFMAFLFGVLLLAQARYESALYVGVAGLVVIIGWRRANRIVLPWWSVVIPLLLIPIALHQRVVANTPLLWELTENATSRFSVSYFTGNVRSAWDFLFSRVPMQANSFVLSTVGLIACAALAVQLLRRRRSARPISATQIALLCFAAGICANTLLVFCYYWSAFTDPMAARFALPLHLVLAVAVVIVAFWIDRKVPATLSLGLLVMAIAIPQAAAKYGYHLYSHVGIDEIEWTRSVVNQRGRDGERLVVTNNSTLPWLLDQRPAILLARARIVADRLAHQLTEPTFREILVLQGMRPTSVDGHHELVPDDTLPDWFKLELIAERRIGTKICRVSRLVHIDLPADYNSPVKSGASINHAE